MSSCYVLSVSVNPGGARESSHWVCNSWSDVKEILISVTARGHGPYLTAWYGRKFELHLVENDVITAVFNPKDWIHFKRLGDILNPEFESDDENGALKCRDQIDTMRLLSYDLVTMRRRNLVEHPYFTIQFNPRLTS